MPDIILETRNLTREFKGFVAVNQVNLQVQRGHIHALIGPNGAGKTTCFNLLTKYLIPTSGQILFNDRDITSLASAQIARMGIIRSFQISAVFPHLNVRGLMAVAPLDEEPATAFRRLKELSDQIVKVHPGAREISAGMSNDFEAAISQGATHIRIGSQILGVR